MKNKNFDKTTFMMVGNSPSTSRTGDTSIIIKMIVNQIAMMIFGLVLQMATSSNDILLLCSSIFSVGFYMVLLYTMCWEVGITDCVKVRGGRMAYKPFRYIKVSILGNLHNIILSLLAVAGYILNNFSTEMQVEWAYTIYGLCNNIMRIIMPTYGGMLYYFNLQTTPYMLIVIIIPSIVFSTLGYFVGVRGRTFRSYFGIKTAYDNYADEISVKQ